MKAYLITTGSVFTLIALAHIWRVISESAALARDPWFILLTVLAAALYAAWGSVLQSMSLADALVGTTHPAISFIGGLVFAAAAGVARERSESVASAIVLHWLCVTVALIAYAAGGAF